MTLTCVTSWLNGEWRKSPPTKQPPTTVTGAASHLLPPHFLRGPRVCLSCPSFTLPVCLPMVHALISFFTFSPIGQETGCTESVVDAGRCSGSSLCHASSRLPHQHFHRHGYACACRHFPICRASVVPSSRAWSRRSRAPRVINFWHDVELFFVCYVPSVCARTRAHTGARTHKLTHVRTQRTQMHKRTHARTHAPVQVYQPPARPRSRQQGLALSGGDA